jgi:hypothetical protein
MQGGRRRGWDGARRRRDREQAGSQTERLGEARKQRQLDVLPLSARATCGWCTPARVASSRCDQPAASRAAASAAPHWPAKLVFEDEFHSRPFDIL